MQINCHFIRQKKTASTEIHTMDANKKPKAGMAKKKEQGVGFSNVRYNTKL